MRPHERRPTRPLRARGARATADAHGVEALEPRRMLSAEQGLRADSFDDAPRSGVTAPFGDATTATPAAPTADGSTPAVPAVAGRHVFYNNSAFDGRNAAATAQDDAAVAPDKVALRPGEAPDVRNVTSYTKGINGIMVDVAGLPPDATPAADDFAFRRGRGGDPSGWIDFTPPQVGVRRGAGVNGSDRITLTWPDGALRNYWLEVTVKPTARTGLPAADVFYFGNLGGETGPGRPTWFSVDAADYVATRAALPTAAAITNRFDFDRDGRVGAFDLATVRNARGESLAGLTPGAVTTAAASASAVPAARQATRRAAYGDAATLLLRD